MINIGPTMLSDTSIPIIFAIYLVGASIAVVSAIAHCSNDERRRQSKLKKQAKLTADNPPPSTPKAASSPAGVAHNSWPPKLTPQTSPAPKKTPKRPASPAQNIASPAGAKKDVGKAAPEQPSPPKANTSEQDADAEVQVSLYKTDVELAPTTAAAAAPPLNKTTKLSSKAVNVEMNWWDRETQETLNQQIDRQAQRIQMVKQKKKTAAAAPEVPPPAAAAAPQPGAAAALPPVVGPPCGITNDADHRQEQPSAELEQAGTPLESEKVEQKPVGMVSVVGGQKQPFDGTTEEVDGGQQHPAGMVSVVGGGQKPPGGMVSEFGGGAAKMSATGGAAKRGPMLSQVGGAKPAGGGGMVTVVGGPAPKPSGVVTVIGGGSAAAPASTVRAVPKTNIRYSANSAEPAEPHV